MYDQYRNQYGATTAPFDRSMFDAGLRQHMLRVFNYMVVGLAITGLVAALVSSTPALYVPLFGSPLKWVVMLAPLAFIFLFTWRIETISASGAQSLFFAFSAVMGLSMASIFLVFTGASIARVFFIAAAMFAGTALYGYTTKADLSRFGSLLIMGVFGIAIAGLVNLFIGSSALQFAVSVIGVLVFTGLTAYDTQNIKQAYAEHYGTEANNKLAVLGALSLYLNFINMFQFLLSLMGQREE